MAKLPNVYLWAWERPENLQFLGNAKVGVAFLAKTIYLTKSADSPASTDLDGVKVRPRMQPLRIVPGASLMAVVRIESLRGGLPGEYSDQNAAPAPFSREQIFRIANEIVSAAQITGVGAIQIDFDATLSEHNFYRELLLEVRKYLPAEMPLSITALASWCIGDRWLEQLPPGTVDEVVPMLFRMGTGKFEVAHYLASGNGFTLPACMSSLGLSTDEAFSRDILSGNISIGDGNPRKLRVYIFSPRAWTESGATPALKEIVQ
jgi:hypothetical protein